MNVLKSDSTQPHPSRKRISVTISGVTSPVAARLNHEARRFTDDPDRIDEILPVPADNAASTSISARTSPWKPTL